MTIKKFWYFATVYLTLVFLLGGCAAFSQSSTAQSSDNTQVANAEVSIADNRSADQWGWWRVSFHRKHHEDDEPQWHIGTLLAYKVVKPIIDGSQQPKLWRFHQRANADRAGHNFSFIFYSSRSDAEKIYQFVKDYPLVKDLLAAHYIERLSFFDINAETRTAIEATSDKSWPRELQKSWPYFMMGASQTWLSLIDEFYQEEQISEEPDLAQQVELFKKLNDKINQVWEQKGHHAFLHHLNALFGYQELYIIDRRLMRF